ncbi:hypothetical protein [Streptomyces massasporeus]|uniref:hypothetical protein n=1 Tax=Streptomyces massasporeus TaxID=67324 RepID=UPI0033E4FB00
MPDIDECQICGAAAPPVPGLCDGVAGYRLIRDPWSAAPSFLDGNLHFSCLEESDRNPEFFDEFTHMLRAGHEEIDSLDGSAPPLTRIGLAMTSIFSGTECSVFQSGVTDRWMVVKQTGPWLRLKHEDLLAIGRGEAPRSPAEVARYRLPFDLSDEITEFGLSELLEALGVADRYAPEEELASIAYEYIDYYAPKRLLEYVVRAPLVIPQEAHAFLVDYARTYTPVSSEDEENA